MELMGLAGWVFGTVGLGALVVGLVMAVRSHMRSVREERIRLRRVADEEARHRLLGGFDRNYHPRGSRVTALPVVNPHMVAKARKEEERPVRRDDNDPGVGTGLVAGIVLGELLSGRDSVKAECGPTTDDQPKFEPGGGEVGGAGASGSWEERPAAEPVAEVQSEPEPAAEPASEPSSYESESSSFESSSSPSGE